MDRTQSGPQVAATDPKDTQPSGSTVREIIATYPTYAEAQRAVDYLSDEKFDVRRVAIVAEGLSFVEQVTGRLNWGRAMWNGLLSGAVIGALIGFFFGIFNFFAPLMSALTLAFYGLLFGGVAGAVIGLIGYAVSGGNRDFTSVSGVQAERYNVMAERQAAAEARLLLERMAID